MRRHVSCKVSTNKRISLDSSLAAQELQKPSPALVEGRSRSIPVGTAAPARRPLFQARARAAARSESKEGSIGVARARIYDVSIKSTHTRRIYEACHAERPRLRPHDHTEDTHAAPWTNRPMRAKTPARGALGAPPARPRHACHVCYRSACQY